jgi:hypothetical protein
MSGIASPLQLRLIVHILIRKAFTPTMSRQCTHFSER